MFLWQHKGDLIITKIYYKFKFNNKTNGNEFLCLNSKNDIFFGSLEGDSYFKIEKFKISNKNLVKSLFTFEFVDLKTVILLSKFKVLILLSMSDTGTYSARQYFSKLPLVNLFFF